MPYAVPPPPVSSLPVVGSQERFPVNRIFCVGRNYAAHIREMGMDERELPFYFMKPASAVVDCSVADAQLVYPPMTANLHHEIELVVAIGREGFEVRREDALNLVFGYATGLDMTRRDLQFAARDKGRPWDFGKGFAQSAPIGAISRAAAVGTLGAATISLRVNGTVRQQSTLDKMIWDVAESLAFLSRYERLLPGDLLMTGTPEGVGPVVAGDTLEGRIEGLEPLHLRVVPPGS